MRDDRRLGVEQRLHARVVLGLDAAAAGHAERRHLRVLQLQPGTSWKNAASFGLDSGKPPSM